MTAKDSYCSGLFLSDDVTITPDQAAAAAAKAFTQLGFTKIRGIAHTPNEVEVRSAQMSVRLSLRLGAADPEIRITALPAETCSDVGTRFAFLLRHLARTLRAEQVTLQSAAVRLNAAEVLRTLDALFAPQTALHPRRMTLAKRFEKLSATADNISVTPTRRARKIVMQRVAQRRACAGSGLSTIA